MRYRRNKALHPFFTISLGLIALSLGFPSEGPVVLTDVIDGGGQPGSSESYRIMDAIAQPLIGNPGSNQNINEYPGFWYTVTESIPPCDHWSEKITITGMGAVQERIFGAHCDGTDGYDSGLDIILPPPPPEFYSYFQGVDPFNYFSSDIRSSEDSIIGWTLEVTNNDRDSTFTLRWDPDSLPDSCCVILADTVNMRTESTYVYCCGNKTLEITYTFDRVPPESLWIEINEGAAYTNDVHITLSLHAIDQGCGPFQISFAYTLPDSWTAWMPFDTIKIDTLTPEEGMKIVWFRVRDFALNVSGEAACDSIILDASPPSLVTLISPPDNAYLNDSTVDFIWNQSTDNLSGVDYYLLQYTPDSGFSLGLVETSLVGTTFTAVLRDTTYYWKVIAVDKAANESDFSGIWHFSIDTQTPEIPVLVSPTDSSILSDNTPTFVWSRVTRLMHLSGQKKHKTQSTALANKATGITYDLRVILNRDTTIYQTSDTIFTLEDTLPDSTLLWQVQAEDDAGNKSKYSSPFTLFIDTKPPHISNTTVWENTSFMGPFPVYSTIVDRGGISSPELRYKTLVDTNWAHIAMDTTGVSDQYMAEIPSQIESTTVWYYIYAEDIAVPPNESRDPRNAPDSSYSFIAGYTGVAESPLQIPKVFFISQNYPNPFAFETDISYAIPKTTQVRLTIYDSAGRVVNILVEEKKDPAYYTAHWNGRDEFGNPVVSGVYFYKFTAGDLVNVKKMILLR